MEWAGPGKAIYDGREEEGMGDRREEMSAMSRAARVDVAEFSEALSSGVLRALDTHIAERPKGSGTLKPWVIWAGIWVGPHDIGGGNNPWTHGGPGELGGGPGG